MNISISSGICPKAGPGTELACMGLELESTWIEAGHIGAISGALVADIHACGVMKTCGVVGALVGAGAAAMGVMGIPMEVIGVIGVCGFTSLPLTSESEIDGVGGDVEGVNVPSEACDEEFPSCTVSR